MLAWEDFPTTLHLKNACNCTDIFWTNDSVRIINGTFLGNSARNFYGDSIGEHLDVIWKTHLGSGKTIVIGDSVETWAGAGWTGQPLLVEEKGAPYLLQGCYDHHLKKINALTGEVVWEYLFDDILKGTGTLYADRQKNDLVIMQGSRVGLGKGSWSQEVFSFRAVSAFTGQERWRMNVKRGASYSRDVDGSAVVLKDTAYIGLENGLFTVFDPGQQNAATVRDSFRPKILQELELFSKEDKIKHGAELVTESSPCRLRDHLYITSGSGHVYGYNLNTKKIDWDFYTGADMDGSPVVTADSCLIITIEKQFIKARGGAMKIDPSKNSSECVVWYFPTGNKKLNRWSGGIIGSAAVSNPCKQNSGRHLAAFTGIDGIFYVVDQNNTETDSLVCGPDSVSLYRTPKILFKARTGASISTPLIIGSRIVVAGYGGIRIYEYDAQYNFREIARRAGGFEATPFVHKGRIYVASRSGFLYCFGKNNAEDLL